MKIFVSSTYLDLKDHRRAVDEIINRLSSQYRGMEYFGSRPFEPEQVCFDEISQCQLFVGIYAHRYGYIPKDAERSITEREFDFAYERGLDCYCYLIEPAFPWPPPFVQHEASLQLSNFLKKVSGLVRSRFTTPDNLAKQVAADLRLAIESVRPSISRDQLCESLHAFCKQEIASTIGPKYIRELYVGRKLNASIKKEIKRAPQLVRVVKSIRADVEEVKGRLGNANYRKLKKDERKPLQKLRRSLRDALTDFASFEALEFPNAELCYPATSLNGSLTKTKEAVLAGQRSISRRLVERDRAARWDDLCLDIVGNINELQRALRPLMLVVDRAGGGKTNLLCRLAEEIGSTHLCLFIAAKSIPYANEESIVSYLSSVYPIGGDPIETALSASAPAGLPVVVIMDGINEHFEPLKFNAAFKALVRRYYGKPLLYVVSCRDIYWKYFEDSWWHSHCSVASRDELYEFTAGEFRKALPLYLRAYDIEASPVGNARDQLHHPLLLRFYCEAFKGSPDQPSRIGRVEDIRLLELFDAYCERKFQQISERLGLLSADEVFDFLQIIARLMLTERTRLLPVRRIAYHIQHQLGERTIRSIDSRYVQILDEDILLEQKPSGLQMDLMVSFVYDEFMEYVIARALWSEMCQRVGAPDYEEVKDVTKTLLQQEKQFISVLGIVVYLGELLATQSQKDALKYVEWLISKKRENLACRLIVRWPTRMLHDSVFHRLIELHKGGRTANIKREAWQAMGMICQSHWALFYDYVTTMPLTGYFRPMYVFGFLGRVNGGPGPEEKLESVKWIARLIHERISIPSFRDSGDYTNGKGAITRIIASAKTIWTKEQLSKAQRLLNKVISDVDGD